MSDRSDFEKDFVLHAELRSRTDDDHRQLDKTIGEVWASRAAYVDYIRMNHAAHRSIEPIIAELVAEHEVLQPYHEVLPALDRDMKRLGAEALDGLTCDVASDDRDLPSAVGILYVLEGSRLGARMIHKRVTRASWSAAQGGGVPDNFFKAIREAGRFSDRIATFDCLIVDKPALERAVSSAKSVFALFDEAARRLKPSHSRQRNAEGAP